MKAMATTATQRSRAFRTRQRVGQRLVRIGVVPHEVKRLITKGYMTVEVPTEEQLRDAVQAFLSDQLFEYVR